MYLIMIWFDGYWWRLGPNYDTQEAALAAADSWAAERKIDPEPKTLAIVKAGGPPCRI